jgi:hypothetical protein
MKQVMGATVTRFLRPVTHRRLGDPLFKAEEPECELW